ncbi:MAG: diacylglycerol kinase family lipid kinase [Alphaproteobacteria bacterium]|nr:diacylglycerol kinase family lipid kinase [Alphaproteobacteria bacterium]
MQVEVIANPTAGGGASRKAARLVALLRERGATVRLRGTRFAGHARALAAEAVAQGVDRLVVAGGDGTINEAINGLAGAGLPLALLPGGTANVLARELGWPARLEAIAELVMSGVERRVSLGAIDGRRFALMASLGLDAEVVAGLDARAKRRFGKLAYAGAAVRRLIGRRPQLYDIEFDGRTERVAAAIVAKARHYGGAFVVAPAARLDAPSFELVIARDPSRWAHLRYAAALGLADLTRASGIETHRVTRVVLAGPPGLPVQADGDPVASTPATVEILPDALTLLVPAANRGA